MLFYLLLLLPFFGRESCFQLRCARRDDRIWWYCVQKLVRNHARSLCACISQRVMDSSRWPEDEETGREQNSLKLKSLFGSFYRRKARDEPRGAKNTFQKKQTKKSSSMITVWWWCNHGWPCCCFLLSWQLKPVSRTRPSFSLKFSRLELLTGVISSCSCCCSIVFNGYQIDRRTWAAVRTQEGALFFLFFLTILLLL